MKIAVCVRQGSDGEISPFDACAYEAALKIKGAEVVLVSMGPASCESFLRSLTRLGAKKAYLLSDKAFAGADTLATAYTLSLAMKKLSPDLIFCGRQTFMGDTAQVGPMLSVLCGAQLIFGVMSIDEISENEIVCTTRTETGRKAAFPALLTFEKINNLRFPSIFSKAGELEVWNAASLGADLSRCGLSGSPTRVLESKENESGKRKCRFIEPSELDHVIIKSLNNAKEGLALTESETKLKKVFTVGESPKEFAESISDDISVIPFLSVEEMVDLIEREKPSAVLWGSDTKSKCLAAMVAGKLGLGLCADCTALETDGVALYMIRPALSGSVIAKIKSDTRPAMATVRTTKSGNNIIVSAGFGAKDCLDKVKDFAEKYGAYLGASRKAVDQDLMPYYRQVGLTGKMVSPAVYIAIGISGAVHHIAGMEKSGTVIAINPDKDAAIFEYADFGIIANAEDVL